MIDQIRTRADFKAYARKWLLIIFCCWIVTTLGILYGVAASSPHTAYLFVLAQLVAVPGIGLSKILEFRTMWRGQEPGNMEAVPAAVSIVIAMLIGYLVI